MIGNNLKTIYITSMKNLIKPKSYTCKFRYPNLDLAKKMTHYKTK